jgi:hypothetical protein
MSERAERMAQDEADEVDKAEGKIQDSSEPPSPVETSEQDRLTGGSHLRRRGGSTKLEYSAPAAGAKRTGGGAAAGKGQGNKVSAAQQVKPRRVRRRSVTMIAFEGATRNLTQSHAISRSLTQSHAVSRQLISQHFHAQLCHFTQTRAEDRHDETAVTSGDSRRI